MRSIVCCRSKNEDHVQKIGPTGNGKITKRVQKRRVSFDLPMMKTAHPNRLPDKKRLVTLMDAEKRKTKRNSNSLRE